MGFSFHGKKHEADKERHLKRLHKTTPLIESPLIGADPNNLVFAQRHEANAVELFFDLFFVANLATFTAYHSITDVDYLLGYVGFFGILWATWFQITLHDVRFARDTLYERICKLVQFIAFVGLALAGSQFNPSSKASGNNQNFRIMCYVLVISRGLLTVQYIVVLIFTMKAKYAKLILPIGLMIGVYALATVTFVAMTPAFKAKGESPHRLIYLVWYVVMVIEAAVVITISSVWRMLSFKKTHLMERMSLLTIIVIGEGAIGVTKTVSKVMGKHGLDVEGCFLIMCIIVILVFLWTLYFDNFPHGHYGTIRQQVWSLLHFPLQLGIVGVVEGSQQLALARYVMKYSNKTSDKLVEICAGMNLDGKDLGKKLNETLDYFMLTKKAETTDWYDLAQEYIYNATNTPGICSSANAPKTMIKAKDLPDYIYGVEYSISNALYVGLGMKIPVDKLKDYSPLEIANKGWKIVYLYYWASFITVILSLIVFLFLIRRHKADLFDYMSIIVRFIVAAVVAAMIGLAVIKEQLTKVISSAWLLPICVTLLVLIIVVDKGSAVYCNWRLKKSGQPYALEFHEHGHDDAHETHGAHGEIEELKQAQWSVHEQGASQHAASTAYQPPAAQGYPMSPPLMSPDPTNPHAHQPHGAGGYMPVAGGQDHGA